ncbi:Uncharacterised protein [Mycobacterium tuberculosis]|nr:Uncharacterised protein [Mycobacterium tuberculosis]CKU66429.1 Uncharacterised protein [Mycobacterium tuberculosis]
MPGRFSSQPSLAPPFHDKCAAIHWWSGSLTHSPTPLGPPVVLMR